jgi:hypothetical protein
VSTTPEEQAQQLLAAWRAVPASARAWIILHLRLEVLGQQQGALYDALVSDDRTQAAAAGGEPTVIAILKSTPQLTPAWTIAKAGEIAATILESLEQKT